MNHDPILAFAEHGRVQFVRSSSGHPVHVGDVARDGFHASPEFAAVIIRLLEKENVPIGPELDEVTP